MDLSIGQMARINHISIQTLRLYDKMGLLKPVAVDAGSGYRYYSILQCAKLDLIGSLKQCGLSLKEIGAYFENGNIESLEGELRNTLDQIGTEMRRLSEQKEAVNARWSLLNSTVWLRLQVLLPWNISPDAVLSCWTAGIITLKKGWNFMNTAFCS